MRLPALFLGAALAVPAFCQTSSAPYDPIQGGPTFTTEFINYTYEGSYTAIGTIDFRNFVFPRGGPNGPFTLKDGVYRHDDPYYHSAIMLDSVYYLAHVALSKQQSALVMLSWLDAGGSTSQGETALLFTISGGRLRVVQMMDWDTHFQTKEAKASFDPQRGTIVARTAHYLPGDAHCCVSAMDAITLHWDGTRFTQIGFRTELSDYGKAEGKRLP